MNDDAGTGRGATNALLVWVGIKLLILLLLLDATETVVLYQNY